MPQTMAKIAFLERTVREVPEYGDILSLFLNLFEYLKGREGETGISFRVPGGHGKEKIAGGFPLLTREEMTVCVEESCRFLLKIVAVLREAGREGDEHLAKLGSAIAAGRLDLTVLFGACMQRERQALDEAALEIDVPSPLMEFVLETALRSALELVAETVPAAAVEGWNESYCPICGSRAGMAELTGEEGRRLLACSACSFTWPFKRLTCPYCGNEDPESLSYFQAGEGPTRVNVCRNCSRYIKTRDSRQGNAGVPLDAEDLVTMHLDLLAAREGFERGK